MSEKAKTNDRGVLLTILLVIAAIGIIASIISLISTSFLEESYSHLPNWYPIYGFVGVMFSIINFIGLLKMKKWIIYSIGIGLASALAIQFVLPPLNENTRMIAIIFTIISGFIWYFPIYRKWKHFE